MANSMWKCSKCGAPNPQALLECYSCKVPRQLASVVDDSEMETIPNNQDADGAALTVEQPAVGTTVKKWGVWEWLVAGFVAFGAVNAIVCMIPSPRAEQPQNVEKVWTEQEAKLRVEELHVVMSDYESALVKAIGMLDREANPSKKLWRYATYDQYRQDCADTVKNLEETIKAVNLFYGVPESYQDQEGDMHLSAQLASLALPLIRQVLITDTNTDETIVQAQNKLDNAYKSLTRAQVKPR